MVYDFYVVLDINLLIFVQDFGICVHKKYLSVVFWSLSGFVTGDLGQKAQLQGSQKTRINFSFHSASWGGE